MDWINIGAAAANVGTAAIAVLVYFEARGIRRLDWQGKATDQWQGFNRLLIENNLAERWSEIIGGKVAWLAMTQTDRMVIYSIMNVLAFEHNAMSFGAIDKNYAEKSLGDNALLLRHVWAELEPHLRADGWSAELLDALAKQMRGAIAS